MSDPFKKVTTGSKLRIPAAAYNTFVDVARDHQASQRRIASTPQTPIRPTGIVLVRNGTGRDLKRYHVLAIDSPIIDPDDNEDEFKNRVALAGVLPDKDEHFGKFVILNEPLKSGAIGRAYVAGVCPVKIDVPDEDHERHYADILDDTTDTLMARHDGAAQILWRAGGTGKQWALVRLGNALPQRVFPVELTLSGGTQGDEVYPASWLYDVRDAITGELLEHDADPIDVPHHWKRPNIGQMIAADYGYAHYRHNSVGGVQLVLGWINETPYQEVCEEA